MLASLCLAAAAAPALSRILCFSCLSPAQPEPDWNALVRTRPSLTLWMGDNVYVDADKGESFVARYQELARRSGFQRLQRAAPSLTIWDDGDYGLNDGGDENPAKADAKAAFLDFWKAPADDARRTRPGIYHAAEFGPEGRRVQVILLDTRWFRSLLKKKREDDPTPGRYDADPDPAKTMLGEAQWLWLEEQLRRPADLRFIVSSIQVVPEDHKWEKWANLPLERARLYSLIRKTKASGVVLLSGDRHLAEVSMMDGGVGYPLYELTASSLNASRAEWRMHEPNRWRVASVNVGNTFGLIEIDWGQPDSAVTLKTLDVRGSTLIAVPLRLSWLKQGKIPFGG